MNGCDTHEARVASSAVGIILRRRVFVESCYEESGSKLPFAVSNDQEIKFVLAPKSTIPYHPI
jgi:hypothetical protein